MKRDIFGGYLYRFYLRHFNRLFITTPSPTRSKQYRHDCDQG